MDKKQSPSELLMIFFASALFVAAAMLGFKQMNPEGYESTRRVLADEGTNLSWDLDGAASRMSRSLEGEFTIAGTRDALQRSIDAEGDRVQRDNVSFSHLKGGDLLENSNKSLGLAKR